MKALEYSEYGPSSVLHVVERPEPQPPAGRIRIAVRAVGVNPFDWKVRSGAFGDTTPSRLPMIPHSDAAGVVDAVGEDVEGVAIGDKVFGVAVGGAAAEHAVLREWAPIPPGMTFAEAAGLPNVVETAGRALALLGLDKPQATPPQATPPQALAPFQAPPLQAHAPLQAPPPHVPSHQDPPPQAPASHTTAVPAADRAQSGGGITLLVNGAAGGVGIAAVQLAVARGATVIGTASERNHEFLRGLGAIPVTYGPGLADRVRALALAGADRTPAGVDETLSGVGQATAGVDRTPSGGDRILAAVDRAPSGGDRVPAGVDRALDTAGRGAVAELVTLTPTPADVVSIADFDAPRHGARVTDGSEGRAYHTLREAAALYAEGRFTMPVERTFPLADAAAAHDLSESGHARGKIILTL